MNDTPTPSHIAKDTEARAEPHGAAAAASVNMAALVPYVMLAALFLVAMFVMHEDAVATGRAEGVASQLSIQMQQAKDDNRRDIDRLAKRFDDDTNRSQQWNDYTYTNLKEIRATLAANKIKLISKDPGPPPLR